MKRKALLFFFFLLSVCTNSAFAEDYYVYAVKGNVSLVQARKSAAVKVRQKLSDTQTINVAAGSTIVLLETKNKKMYTINQECNGTVKSLITAGKSSVKDLTLRYFKYLWAQLNTKDSDSSDTYMQRTTSAYRDADSLLVKVDSTLSAPADSVSCCK